MAVEPGIYTGTPTVHKNTTLLTSTLEKYMPKFVEVFHTSTNVLKAFALQAFGKAAVMGNERFGNVTKSSGKGIMFNDGGYQFSGPLMTSGPSLTYVDRLGNINPEYVDPATGWAYAWKRAVCSIMVPEENVMDNAGSAKLMDILETNAKLAQMSVVRDIKRGLLGASTAPTGSPTGLDDLVAVTQTATIGGIASTNSYWQNRYLACTSVGGGGEMDRPLAMLRAMQSLNLRINALSGSSNSKLLLGTQGAYQYYLRAQYADSVQGGNPSLQIEDYLNAGIDHAPFNGSAFIYDADVTVPTGATASTEAIYFLDLESLGMCFKRDQYFKVDPWEAPRTKDKQRFYQTNIWVRWTPFVSNRRVQGVLYNMPANSDATAQ